MRMMDDSCAYCGDEIEGEGVRQGELTFCSQECLDAYNEDSFDDIDEVEFDEI
jgi:hypothetical protein